MSQTIERDVPEDHILELHYQTDAQWRELETSIESFDERTATLLTQGKVEGYRILLMATNDELGICMSGIDKGPSTDQQLEILRLQLKQTYAICRSLRDSSEYDEENFALQESMIQAKKIKFNMFTVIAELALQSILLSCRDMFSNQKIAGFLLAANKKLREYLDEAFDDQTFTHHKEEFFHYSFMSLVVREFEQYRDPSAIEGLSHKKRTFYSRTPWMTDALCLEIENPLKTMFPHDGQGVEVAKAICRRCLVKEECGEYAVKMGMDHGVWGGYSERERRRIRKQLDIQAESHDNSQAAIV